MGRLWQTVCMHNEHPLLDFIGAADRNRLVRAAARLLGPADAEDAVQDAYVRALESNSDKLNVAQAWLLTVVRNLAIDRLRRRHWMLQWLAEGADGSTAAATSHSAETDAALAQEVVHALRLIAAHLSPVDGATVLLHEVFEVDHANIAWASGRSDAASRQQLRRALMRLRQQATVAPKRWPDAERDTQEEAHFGVYLQALQLRDPQTLWAMLRQPTTLAMATTTPAVTAEAVVPAPHATASGVVQVGGKLCLVLTLDGVTLCVLPLGSRPADALATA